VKRMLLVSSVLAALLFAAPVFAGMESGAPSKWENVQVGVSYLLYHPKVQLGYKLTKFKSISCGTGHEPWVAATYGGKARGFDVFEGHPICSDPGESARVGNPRIMGVKAYLGVYCDPTQKCTKAQGVKNGFLLTWNAKPAKPYKKNTSIQLNSRGLTLAQLMKVVRGLRRVG
jgi:hypothetical protein